MPERPYRLFPKTLAECVAPLTRPVLKKRGLEVTLVQQWQTIVGPELAAYVTPDRVVFSKGKRAEGTLHVTVDSAHALALQYAIPLILERLAQFYGYCAIAQIQMQQQQLQATSMNPTIVGLPQDAELAAALAGLAKELAAQTDIAN